MIVVSNTSPIINLAAVDQLDVLPRLYGNVVLPQVVYDEIVRAGEGLPGSTEVANYDWIQHRTATNRSAVKAMQVELDVGEAEAIVLAQELIAHALEPEQMANRIELLPFPR